MMETKEENKYDNLFLDYQREIEYLKGQIDAYKKILFKVLKITEEQFNLV